MARYYFITGGSGRLIGTETNKTLMDKVTNWLQADTETGVLELNLCSPDTLPFIPNMFECVYNVNGLYHWEDLRTAIYRVLRPGCLFLTCVHKNNVPTKKELRAIRNHEYTIEQYVDTLKDHGFVRVRIHEHRNAHSGFKYQTVLASTRARK